MQLRYLQLLRPHHFVFVKNMADTGVFYGGLPASHSITHGVPTQRNSTPYGVAGAYPSIPDYAAGSWPFPTAIPPELSTSEISKKLDNVLEILTKQTEEMKSLKDDNKSLKKEMEMLKVQGISTAKKEKLPTDLSVRQIIIMMV